MTRPGSLLVVRGVRIRVHPTGKAREDSWPPDLDEVGKHFEVSRERIRQIETRTIAKLRHPLRADPLRSYLEGD